jgi:hypothetical protein
VQWLGAERILTGIVSPRDSCEAREAYRMLWLGEGLCKCQRVPAGCEGLKQGGGGVCGEEEGAARGVDGGGGAAHAG